MDIDALGFVEVLGYVAGIEAADAMLKTAEVRLLAVHELNPGMITVEVEGNLAACRVAVNAGCEAAQRLGLVIASNVIGRPDPDTEIMVLTHIPNSATSKIQMSVAKPDTKLKPDQSLTCTKVAAKAPKPSNSKSIKQPNNPTSANMTQLKKLKADKQGKAMTQAARQWASSVLGEIGKSEGLTATGLEDLSTASDTSQTVKKQMMGSKSKHSS